MNPHGSRLFVLFILIILDVDCYFACGKQIIIPPLGNSTALYNIIIYNLVCRFCEDATWTHRRPLPQIRRCGRQLVTVNPGRIIYLYKRVYLKSTRLLLFTFNVASCMV